jgi:hypothetical protein
MIVTERGGKQLVTGTENTQYLKERLAATGTVR